MKEISLRAPKSYFNLEKKLSYRQGQKDFIYEI